MGLRHSGDVWAWFLDRTHWLGLNVFHHHKQKQELVPSGKHMSGWLAKKLPVIAGPLSAIALVIRNSWDPFIKYYEVSQGVKNEGTEMNTIGTMSLFSLKGCCSYFEWIGIPKNTGFFAMLAPATYSARAARIWPSSKVHNCPLIICKWGHYNVMTSI